MSEPGNNKIPGPVYAVAGAGDLAYQQLRKLPTVLSELSGRAVTGGAALRERSIELRERSTELRERAAARSTELRERARSAATALRAANAVATDVTSELDLDRLRSAARRNAAAVIAGAQAAQERAVAVYEDLVARGSQLIDGPAAPGADPTAPATPAVEPATPAMIEQATPQAPAKKPAKATKRTRPATGD